MRIFRTSNRGKRGLAAWSGAKLAGLISVDSFPAYHTLLQQPAIDAAEGADGATVAALQAAQGAIVATEEAVASTAANDAARQELLAANPLTFAARDQAVAAKTVAETARAQAVEAANLNYQQAPVVIGRPVDPVQSAAAASHLVFVWLDQVGANTTLVGLKFWAGAAGTITLARYTLANGIYSLVASRAVAIGATGLRTLTVADFGDEFAALQAGEYLALSNPNGMLRFSNSSAQDGAGIAQINGTGGGSYLGAAYRFEVQWILSRRDAVVTAAAFTAVKVTADTGKTTATAAKASADRSATAVALLSKEVATQTIGRPVDPVAGQAASNLTFVWLTPVASDGKLSQVKLTAGINAQVSVARYTRAGSAVTRVAVSAPMDVVAGLNTLTLTDFAVTAGECLAIVPSAAGVISFTGNNTPADGDGWAQIGPNAPLSTTLGGTVVNQRIEVGFALTTPSQTVTAQAFAQVSEAAATASAKANSHDTAIAALKAPVTQTIGRSSDPATGLNASQNTFVWLDAATVSGQVQVKAFCMVAGTIRLVRYSRADNTVTRTALSASYALTPGLNTINITDVAAVVGELLGFVTSAAGVVAYKTGAADGAGWVQIGSSPPLSVTINPIASPRIEASFTVTDQQQVVTGDAFKALQAQVAVSGQSLMGKKVGVLGDSLSTRTLYGPGWQNAFVARTGALLSKVDARPGRTWRSALEGYGAASPLSSLAALTGYVGATPCTGQLPVSGTLADYAPLGMTEGGSFAAWLSTLDLLVIWLGTNDGHSGRPIGTLADAYTAGSFHGDINFLLDAVQTMQPLLPVLVVTPHQTKGWYSYATGRSFADAIQQNCASRGIPVLDLYAESGISPLTFDTMLRDDGSSGATRIHGLPATMARIGQRIANALSRLA